MTKIKDVYTPEERICPHCGGSISAHWGGASVIRWCDDCGSNNPKTPPNVEIEIEEELEK